MFTLKRLLLWLVAGIILVSIFNFFGPPPKGSDNRINYSDFVSEVKNNNVESVTISGQDVVGVLKNHQAFSTHLLQPISDDSPLTKEMLEKKIVIKSVDARQPPLLVHLLNLLPWIILFVVWIFVWKRKKSMWK